MEKIPTTSFAINLTKKIAIGGAALLGTGLAALYFYQDKLLYMPSPPGMEQDPDQNAKRWRNPGERKLPYEDVTIQSGDNIRLQGWFIKQQQPENYPTVVFFHENAGNIGYRLEYFQNYHLLVQANILAIAYRGYSKSEGKPNFEGIQKDSQAIYKYIFSRKDINQNKIFAHGRSLGGAVAVDGLVNGKFQNKIAGVILENTFTSIQDMVKKLLPPVSIFSKFILKSKWDTLSLIPKVTSPLLFIKSLQDELVPTEQMDILQKSVSNQKIVEDYVIPNGTHNENWTVNRQEYFAKIKNFFDKNSLQNNNNQDNLSKMSNLQKN